MYKEIKIHFIVLFNSLVSEKDKSLLHKLAVQLDKTPHRVVKDWEFLANTPEINAPLHVWLRCRIRTERSCTLLLFDVLRAGFAKKTLGNMIDALEEIKRRDVNRIITAHCSEVYPSMLYFFGYFPHVLARKKKTNKISI